MEDEKFLVMSGLGTDRPGLVAAATRFLVEHGLNVEDSRAAVLGGEFGLMMLASGTSEKVGRVLAAGEALNAATGMTFVLRETISPEAHRRRRALPYRVEANALDHEGIALAVTDALHRAGINIVSLETAVRNAPITGTEVFSLVARVDIPDGVSPAAVREALNAVARDQNLDIEMRAGS